MKTDRILDRELGRVETRLKTGDGRLFTGLRKSSLTVAILLSAISLFQLRGLPGSLSTGILDAALIVQPRSLPDKVRLIVINDQDYETRFHGESPLDPGALAQIIAAIWKGHPSMIVIDVDTGHPKFNNLVAPEEAPIVWATDFEEVGGGRITPRPPLAGRRMPLPSAWSSAVTAIPNDQRGIVRGYDRQFINERGTPEPFVAWEVAQRLRGQVPRAPLKASQNQRLLDFRYQFPARRSSPDDPLSLGNILEHANQEGWARGLLHDKVVVLGGAYRAARDERATPVGTRFGSQIVAEAIEAEITNTSIEPASRWAVGLIQLLAGLLLIVIHRRLGLRSAFWTSLVLIPVLSIAASFILFHRFAGWFAIVPILAVVLVSELYANSVDLLKLARNSGVIKEPESVTKTQAAGQA